MTLEALCRVDNSILTFTELRRQEDGTASTVRQSVVVVFKTLRHTEVTDLNCTIFGHEQIVGLNIAMCNVQAMHYNTYSMNIYGSYKYHAYSILDR